MSGEKVFPDISFQLFDPEWELLLFDIDIEDNTYSSSSEQTKTTFSQTDYYYGLGFRPTDNLQIDLLGFLGGYGDEEDLLDADFYKQLRLSFTLKF